MVLPRVEHDDRLSLRHATVDLVRVDGHAPHGERRGPCVARELRDADEGTCRRVVRRHLHDCARRGYSGCWADWLGNLARTTGYHEVCTADEDGDDGGGGGEDRE